MSPPPTSSGEYGLRERFLAGEPAALSEAAAIVGRVIALKGYYVPAGERADLRQETLFQAWREVRKAGAAFEGRFEAFLRAIAHRRCIDWVRTHRKTEAFPEDGADSAASPEDAARSRERRTLGAQVIARLRAPCRELFRLHAGENLSYREIAAREGRTEGALRVQMSTCLKEARRLLARLRGQPIPRTNG